MNFQSLLLIFWVEGVGGDSEYPLKEYNDIFKVLLFSEYKNNVSMKTIISYCLLQPICFIHMSILFCNSQHGLYELYLT